MAQSEVTHTCGTKKITYPAGSTFVCTCPPSGKCVWVVILDDGTVFTGTELVAPPRPKPPHVSISGSLKLIAVGLQRVLKRHVVIPPKLRNQMVPMKTFKGSARDVAAGLGLKVTKKRV